MREEHIKIQYERLKRHYQTCIDEIDEIGMLDLAHCLRIWVEMAKSIDALMDAKRYEVQFPNTELNKKIKSILKNTSFTSVPLASISSTVSEMSVKGIHIVNRALSPEEIKKIYEAGPPQIRNINLSFEQWLGSEILETKDLTGKRIGLARTILIKRVANLLGASHPEGKENEDEFERHFDPFIKELHAIHVAKGFPLTYYQLIEIAEVILRSFDNLL